MLAAKIGPEAGKQGKPQRQEANMKKAALLIIILVFTHCKNPVTPNNPPSPETSGSSGQDAYEPDNTWDDAKPILVNGSPFNHRMAMGDEDWHVFSGAAGMEYTVRTSGEAIHYLYLYSTSGSRLLPYDYGADISLEFLCDRTDTYYIRIMGYKGSYSVSVTGTVVLDTYEPDNSSAEAKPIFTDGVPVNHILPSGDEDWHYFTAAAGAAYTIETFGDVVDTYMYLLAPDGNTILAEDDNSGSNVNARITYPFATGGTYYFAVMAYFGSEPGKYSVSVTQTL
jgi:hypothetical protein